MTEPDTLDVPFVGGPIAGQTLTVPVDENGRPINTVEIPTTLGPDWIGRVLYDIGQQQSPDGPTWVYLYRRED